MVVKVLLTLGLAFFLFASMVPPRARASSPPVGDVNGDCRVNIIDLGLVAERYGTAVGFLPYSPQYDLNQDGVINILDVQSVAAHYNEHC